MGEVEHILFKALHTLSLRADRHGLLSSTFEKAMHNSDDMTIVVKSISSDGGLFDPRRYMIELEDWGPRRPSRPGVYTNQARKSYEYESTAEEIIEIDEPRKELSSG